MTAFRRLGLAFALIFGLAWVTTAAQGIGVNPLPENNRVKSGVSQASISTGTQPAQDSLGKQIIPAKPDTLARPKSRADSVIVVKHDFNHQEQIITGSVIMTCLALILVAMNNYNPR